MKEKRVIYFTYFDKGFLLKGLALHSSLIKYNQNARMWIFAFDEYSEKILRKLKLKGVKVIRLKDFEDKKLLSIKDSRSAVEYMWTTTPSIPLYIF